MSKSGIQKFRAAVEVLKEVYDEIPIQQILLFLEVAEHGEVPQSELRQRLGAKPPSLSRNIRMLSRFPVEDYLPEETFKGHDLIDRRHDVNNPRTLMVFLTKKGIEVRDRIEAACK